MNKEFKYFDLCEVFDYSRGERLIELAQIPGEVAYISSTMFNNGISNYVTPPENMKVYRNVLTISNSGSVGYLFYHDYDIVASDHVTVLWPKSQLNVLLTRNIALFLKPIFEKISYKYNFGRELSNRNIERETIFLPVDDDGSIDWKYMDEYVHTLISEINFTSIKTNNSMAMNIDISTWKEFSLVAKEGGLFIYKHGKRLTVQDRIAGHSILITAGQLNQGYSQKIGNYDDEDLFDEGITIDMFSNVFYQNHKFSADDNIYVLNEPLKLNKYASLFIITLLRMQKYKYGFGRQFRKEDLYREKVLLPVKSDGLPDFQFMEEFIKRLPYGDKI